MVTWCDLRAFATLFVTFWRGRSGAGRAVWTIFREFSCMAFALWGITSIVRFWELIACKPGPFILERLVVCFVGFSGGAGNWGLDNWATRRRSACWQLA